MSAQKKTIFLVDDNFTNLAMGKKALEGAYNVITLESGELMLEMLENIRPDLILLDVLMPGMDGYEAIRLLKSNGRTADIPVIFLSAVSGVEVEVEGLSLGAVDYISKPISPRLLFKRVEMHMLVLSQKKELVLLNDNLTHMISKQVKEKVRIRNSFRKYIDPKLADAVLMNSGENSDTVGKKQHIAVLFADVRGFTSFTEQLKDTPETVVEILNELLEVITKAVFDNGGSVDKFVGDAVMALFNGFVEQDDYVYFAAKAAHEIIQGSASVLSTIKERVGIELGVGVGVHCGEAIVGNVGPDFRKDYTAIGDTINVASRLEAVAMRSEVLISKAMYDSLKGRIDAQSMGEMALRGKREFMEVYLLTGVKPAQ